ncbi:glycosyltransferase family 4 protein [Riemerella columbina]|uniref:glycosyltransferase family 4 protein n=1 Tax=Riemerella columbina TaxID=103810 RepID=UPI00036726C2|nr:glycosyltransferase family 1 protein [Riemerella columbina]
MKIAYDAKRFFHNASGLGNYSRDLVRILAEYYPDNDYQLWSKNKSERGAEILALPNVSFHPISNGFLERQLKMGVEAQNAGATIFHGLSGELPLKWNGKKIKKVVTIHDLIFMRFSQFYSFFDRKIHYWKFKKAAESADLVIAISEQTKRDIIEFLGISEDKIRVVYQGCHAAFKTEISQDLKQKITNKYELPERFILNVGTIEPRKNLLSVVKALRETEIPLVVVGKKTSYYKKVEQEIAQYKQKVKFLSGVTMRELAAIYQMTNLFIYPSLFEGFGIPVIEALFSKTPVITSNLSCLPEAGGADSIYINPYSAEDIRAKILHLWDNEEERNRRADKGFEFVQKFNDDTIAKNLMAVYQELI